MAEKTQPQKRRGKIAATDLQHRIDDVRSLLEAHTPKGEIKRAICAKYGCDSGTVERYLSRAREQLLLEVHESREYWRARSLATYLNVLRADDATHRDKIRAQAQIDRLLGLNAPIQIAQTDSQGRDLSPDQARGIISEMAARIFERERKLGRLEGPPVADGPTLD